MSQEDGKKACGYRAAELIEDGMHIGIGTGSTVFYFIQRLTQRCQTGLQIKAAFSSIRSKKQALDGGIPPIKDDLFTHLDMTVDGADEIDPHHSMIKGGGGALLREKMLASSSSTMLVIVDETKCVKQLGKVKLPVEICQFAYTSTIEKIQNLGHTGNIRIDKNGAFYLTDNGNYIYDIHLKNPLIDPAPLHLALIQIAGVVETGLFFDLPTKLIVGKSDGSYSDILS